MKPNEPDWVGVTEIGQVDESEMPLGWAPADNLKLYEVLGRWHTQLLGLYETPALPAGGELGLMVVVAAATVPVIPKKTRRAGAESIPAPDQEGGTACSFRDSY